MLCFWGWYMSFQNWTFFLLISYSQRNAQEISLLVFQSVLTSWPALWPGKMKKTHCKFWCKQRITLALKEVPGRFVEVCACIAVPVTKDFSGFHGKPKLTMRGRECENVVVYWLCIVLFSLFLPSCIDKLSKKKKKKVLSNRSVIFKCHM